MATPGTLEQHPPSPMVRQPRLTSCSSLLWLGAAGVHVHQELRQAPHAGTKGSSASRGTVGQLRVLQVLVQQPGQGTDTISVCKANQTQSQVPLPGARHEWVPESTGYLGW